MLGEYPLSVEQCSAVSNWIAVAVIDNNEIVRYFIMRRLNESIEELWFSFVTVNSEKRGQGYEKIC